MVAIKTSDYALRKAIIEANAMVSDNKGAGRSRWAQFMYEVLCTDREVISRNGGDLNSPALEKGRSHR